MLSRAIAVRPVISVTPERLVVREGEPAQFSCKVTAGRPTPQVSLIKSFLQFDLKYSCLLSWTVVENTALVNKC